MQKLHYFLFETSPAGGSLSAKSCKTSQFPPGDETMLAIACRISVSDTLSTALCLISGH